MTNIVILDGYTANPGDISWQPIEALGSVTLYDRTPPGLIVERAKDAEIIVTNKCKLDGDIFKKLPNLKCICLLATGYDNIDIAAAKAHGITVRNAVGYSTIAVAQHVFALLLELTNKVGLHNQSVQNGEWANGTEWSYWKSPIMELSGKTLGILGFGKIGQQVAKIALAFGMTVIATRNSDKPSPISEVEIVPQEVLFKKSDVISLHTPLTAETQYVINQAAFFKMKNTVLLVNTGRGGLILEADLKRALLEGQIAGAALDVLSQEPPPNDHPLMGLSNCFITPHHAWASKASRERLVCIVAENIKGFLAG